MSLLFDLNDRHVNATQVVSVDIRPCPEENDGYEVVLKLADGTAVRVAGPERDRAQMEQQQGQWSRKVESAMRSLHNR